MSDHIFIFTHNMHLYLFDLFQHQLLELGLPNHAWSELCSEVGADD
jgi:hypothetical protein